MALQDRILDEAIAAAKRWSHEEVEPRHVLWGIVRVLGSSAPADLNPEAIRPFLEPPGVAVSPPTISAAAQTVLDGCVSTEGATAQARSVAAALASGSSTPAAPDAGPQVTSRPVVAQAEPDATSAAAELPSSGPVARESIASILGELDALVGLAPVKVEVRRLVAVQRLNAERRRNDLPEVDGSAHLVFTGDPGTGKTTVARLIARLYGALGVVSQGHLVEATRADLVAGYVGQTALKVQDLVLTALGGVLFVDEAYALARGELVDFGDEAVAMLVKMMEDHRDNLAVIVAGYREEMWDFIRSNPGLRSRFTHYIDFPNYDAPELAQIFESIAGQARVRVDASVLARVGELVEEARSVEDFGNARFARSLFERAYANMAARAAADDRIDPDELDVMIAADLPEIESSSADRRRRIGFGAN